MPSVDVQSFRGDVIVEASVADPYRGDPDPLLNREQGVCVQLKASEVVGTWKTWTHRWLLTTPDLFGEIVRPFAAGTNPRLWMRIGVRLGDSFQWGEWDQQMVLRATQDTTAASEVRGGAYAILTTVDPLYELSVREESAARKGSISEIVQAVAGTQFTRFAVEPTVTRRHAYIQAYESGLDFIHRVRRAAVNRDGSTDYLVYSRGGALHFHTPGWQVAEVKRLAYQRKSSNDAGDLMLSVVPQERDNVPGQGITLVAHDPIQGSTASYVAQTDNEIQFATGLLDYPDAAKTQYLLRHVGPNQLQDLQVRTQQKFSASRLGFFRASMTITNYPFTSVGDVVEFDNGSDAGFDGLWLVGQVTHALEGAVLKSGLMLWREGFTPASVAATTATTGRKLTLGEIAASSRTRQITGDETLPDGSIIKAVTPNG